ncbi:probable carbohydrate esterase At4g34215 [Gastrolobium bilobum]|uniref:probable carbohydrate esterase At4g34215 n=1 Tax=Gastrolobium bilobum TaxID=150636 RepID=UPI002AB0C701|nr:probable carbohydrate esterase At4g34215 [Gastrolobium bilobum]
MAMVMSVLSWFLCVLVAVQCGSCAKDIFILGGQSNMAGRGGVHMGKWDGNVPPECKPNPSILRLSEKLQWEEAREPLHADIDVAKTCGVGPGMAFANEVVKVLGAGCVGLVPCAVGGTRISQWSRGSHLYNELVQRSTHSMRDGGGGTIRALLWYQGESDTVREEDAEAYKHKMETFIMDLRSDLHLPSLLVIQVALASGEGKFTEKVRQAQLGITLPNVKCVDAKGLRLKADKLHLTTISEVHVGIHLAHAYLASVSHQFNHTQLS